MCGDSAPSVAVTNAECQEVCSGDPLSKCGGKGPISVYSSSEPITGLTLTSDAAGSVITAGTTVTFDFRYDDP